MPGFTKGGALRAPFGKNEYLRSVVGCKFESYTVSRLTVPTEAIDGYTNQQVLQPGTVLAKITSGGEAGKVGPFRAAGSAADEVQRLTPGGTISAGTFTITTALGKTGVIQWNATAANVQSALEPLYGVGNVTASGGPINSAFVAITFTGGWGAQDIPQITVTDNLLTGTAPTLTPSTTTPGVPGANDGRQTLANIVGLCDTFLPWQLMERDVEVASMYIGTAVQAWCFELDANGVRQPLSNTTADAMRSVKGLDVTFK